MAFLKRFNLSLGMMAALMFLLASATIAYAHEVEPTTLSPAPGAVLQKSPDEVRLTFSEEIAETGSTLQVFDAQGKQVDSGGGVDLNDAAHQSLAAKLPALAEGVYLVKWKITLSDGDATQGEYYFGVGNVTVPQPEAEATTPTEQPAPPVHTGTSMIVWGVLIAVLVVVAAVIVFQARRPRSHS